MTHVAAAMARIAVHVAHVANRVINATSLHHGAHLRMVATGMIDTTSSASALVHSLHA